MIQQSHSWAYILRKPWLEMFIAALFTIAKTLKQPKCPLTDEWIKKMWYLYTMEYYSVIKKTQNWVICSEVDGPRVCHTEWSKSEREKQILYADTYIWNLKKEKKKGRKSSEEPTGKMKIKMQTFPREWIRGYRRGKGKLGQSERVEWTYIHYQT